MEMNSPNSEENNTWSASTASGNAKHRMEESRGGNSNAISPKSPDNAALTSVGSGSGSDTHTPPAARIRGLTSTLSGRRHHRVSIMEHGHSSSSPTGTAPDHDSTYMRAYGDLYDSQAIEKSTRENTISKRSPESHQSSRKYNPQKPEYAPAGTHIIPVDSNSRVNSRINNSTNRNINDNTDNYDDAPPESLLYETSVQPRPLDLGLQKPTLDNDKQNQHNYRHPDTEARPHKRAGEFVRKAARSLQDRLYDFSSQGMRTLETAIPLPPPRRSRHNTDTYGDGRIYSIEEERGPTLQTPRRHNRRRNGRSANNINKLSYRERALRAWRDPKRQDEFFCLTYSYYVGKGALTIILSRVLHLATLGFVAVLSTFVFGCIDHSKVREQKSLSAVVIPQCIGRFSWTTKLFLWSFGIFWCAQLVRTLLDIPAILEMRAFYTEALGVSPSDIGTIAWHEVVERMVKLREAEINEYKNIARSRILNYRLTADIVINRIMRRENYMIALFNKGILNIKIPGLGKRQHLTKALEWNLSFCLMSYLFDERGQLRRRFLKESNRAILSEGLRRRFKFMAVINMMFAPFIVLFLVLYSFFRYFEELYHEPGALTSRAFTPLAKWKFRNFNEVPHSLRRRLNSAHPKAMLYLGQFRNEVLISVARFVSFIAGSFTAILLVFTVFDNELSLEFEITRHRTVLFYIGLFGTILAAARGMIPSDEQEYLHPAWIIRDVLEDLQYMEPEWRGKLDTTKVRSEFEVLFDFKLSIFLHELLGVASAPFVMLFSLPQCANEIIDFFREFTVHVDHLGYVCSFAIFDFERHGNIKFAAPTRITNTHMASKNGKMEQSLLHFKSEYPEWTPRNEGASVYLQRAQNAQHDLWQMGSFVSGTGWQARLLQQQRMAGSVFPTGASLYQPPSLVPGENTMPLHTQRNNVTTSTATRADIRGNITTHKQTVDPAARSQFAFRPLAPNTTQNFATSQAMLPFNPTLGSQPRTTDKGKESHINDNHTAVDPGHLALSALPLVASPEMSSSLSMSGNVSKVPQLGVFSIMNHLYEQSTF